MISVYNPANTYYSINLHTGERKRIGTEEDFVKKLAASLVCKNKKLENEYSAWEYVNPDLAYVVTDTKKEMAWYRDSTGMRFQKWTGNYVARETTYVDGLGRIVNPEELVQKAKHYLIYHESKKPYWCRRHSSGKDWRMLRQRTKSCSGHAWRRQSFHNVMQAKRWESMFKYDVDFAEYRFKNILDHNNMPESWWDDKSRRTQGNWKFQYKVNRQYNIHTSMRDGCSIRKYAFADVEDYTEAEIDAMLEEDFLQAAVG